MRGNIQIGASGSSDTHSPRQQTIDAHQSRIKQLQDTFLLQIKEAGRLEVRILSVNVDCVAHVNGAGGEGRGPSQENYDGRKGCGY